MLADAGFKVKRDIHPVPKIQSQDDCCFDSFNDRDNGWNSEIGRRTIPGTVVDGEDGF